MYPNIRQTSVWHSAFFFVFFTLVVTLGLNIVVGIVIDGFQATQLEREAAAAAAAAASAERGGNGSGGGGGEKGSDEESGRKTAPSPRRPSPHPSPSLLPTLGRKWWTRDLLDENFTERRVYALTPRELISLEGATGRIEVQLRNLTAAAAAAK